ncbi:magnesium transporter protein 1-like [Echinops telfairi]|uniref:Magnesium transporter protein 1-like n=1 Tax=Echinops telfairi TaxID=9371 RepID=A0AC55DSX1_ECHTE|nr:magnesium transporter protein 1-like [Echinops telfairi]
MAAPCWLGRIPLAVWAALLLLLVAPGSPSNPALRKKVLAGKVSQLMDWTQASGGVIPMNDTAFYHFVLQPPRNYSVIVLFTALREARRCDACQRAANEFQILASSPCYSEAFSKKVFFAMVDYDANPGAFQMVRLVSVPNFLHFAAKRAFATEDSYNSEVRDFTARQIAAWIAQRTQVRPRLRCAPESVSELHLCGLGAVGAVGAGLLCLVRRTRALVSNKTLWAVLALSFATVMTSGQMWVQIRGAPFSQRNPCTGQVHYIDPQNHVQFAAETYLVALCQVCISLGVVFLDAAATSRRPIVKRKMMYLIGVGLVATVVSWLLSLFRRKVPGYPYRLLTD